MAAKVIFAVYGGLKGGNSDSTEARIVTTALQGQLSKPGSNGVVRIDNTTMGGDPAPGVQKHFGAIVEVDGPAPGQKQQLPFACLENQTIDFT
jgi:hypothetical protein